MQATATTPAAIRSMRLVPAGLLLLAIAGCGGEAFNTRWTSRGYDAFDDGKHAMAQQYYEGATRETPNEPYYELNLAAAYQAQGRMDLAAPYYRLVLEHGATVRPARVTAGSRARTLAEIACDNLKLAPPGTAGQALPCQPVAAAVAPPAPVAAVPPPIAQAAPPQPPAVPAAAAAPLAPPPLTRNLAHAIYFEFDSATVTAEGRSVIDAVIRDASNDPALRILLVGKSDRAGAADYNLRLSERRAASVRDALVAGGVAVNRVEVRGVGEAEPPVPTPDAVREPRNRVVEVTLR